MARRDIAAVQGKPPVKQRGRGLGDTGLVAESPGKGTAGKPVAVPGAAKARARVTQAGSPSPALLCCQVQVTPPPAQQPVCTPSWRQGWILRLFVSMAHHRQTPSYSASPICVPASPQHIAMATPPGSGILGITGSFCFHQQAKGGSSLGLLFCQPVHLFSFSFPTSTPTAGLLQLPLSLRRSLYTPFLPLL